MDYINSLRKSLILCGYGKRYQKICLEYAENLLDNQLPVIFDKKHLSLLMGVKPSILGYYIFNSDNFYKEHRIPKSNGDFRVLSAPSFNLKSIQRWILVNVLYKYEVSDNANGFVIGKSIKDNAEPHVGKEIVINIDIKDFFPTITFERVFYIFYNSGYTKEVSFTLTKLLTYNQVLPQGSPASPYLANIVCDSLDKRLSGLASKINASYTRYADDITFSGDFHIVKYIKTLRNIIESESFSINEDKLRIQKQNNAQEVTGLTVNNGVKVKRRYKKNLEQQIYYCKKYGVYSHLEHTRAKDKSFFKEYLYGMASYIKMIEPETGEHFLRELDQIKWDY
ncbi:retron St85 family RNA-directed DNA polymerase [Bacillus velezensis]|uniref:retron St85 family RNA-directed DNA polymerase n=1 Tax=Bacillus velezensis TaxID=492670 RepID=UPI002DBDA446|nr:retron St85 family RNA-directed DNA polymerase [Bacillus velezensis]MEC1394746.1 retron St85 family RNA-directed DNA polymerase [Bacillus velezensis]